MLKINNAMVDTEIILNSFTKTNCRKEYAALKT